ncbi:hypothetical protein [Streptomyces sp. NPDC056069]|uniref:hypothetical protein n=1 Tax=Streptomyces sp. NPDC056069 TaxID=3345702 RepID=UPI0035E31B8F
MEATVSPEDVDNMDDFVNLEMLPSEIEGTSSEDFDSVCCYANTAGGPGSSGWVGNHNELVIAEED